MDKKKRDARGPAPETLKIEGEWEQAVKKALHKKRPPKAPRRKKPR